MSVRAVIIKPATADDLRGAFDGTPPSRDELKQYTDALQRGEHLNTTRTLRLISAALDLHEANERIADLHRAIEAAIREKT